MKNELIVASFVKTIPFQAPPLGKETPENRPGATEQLLRQLWNSQSTILLRATRSQWREACHEEVQTWERHQVHCNLAQVAVQLSGETQAASNTAHRSRHQMVQVTISWGGQFQSAETNVVQGFIVQQKRLVRVLHQLVEAQHCLCRTYAFSSHRKTIVKTLKW